MDRGPWWATVHGVTKSQTERLTLSLSHNITAGIQELARSEQARRVTDWRRERRWEMVELKDRQQ